MTVFQAVILGILQGATEFLPISSSGHLVFAQHYLKGFHQPGILLDVLLHLGTLFAVVIYYWKDIAKILRAVLIQLDVFGWWDMGARDTYQTQRRLVLLIAVGTIPTALIGFLFKDSIEMLFSSVSFTASMLIVTGIILAAADRIKGVTRKIDSFQLKDSFIIGFVQGVAILPGISRSGSTIATGLFRKIDGEEAARFSFLLSIPAIIGAVILEVPSSFHIQADEV